MSHFYRHSLMALILLACLTLSGSQNTPEYWTNWQYRSQQWLEASSEDCMSNEQRPLQTACNGLWHQVLRAAADYNREVNEAPGRWWRRWLYPQLPECVGIPQAHIPTSAQFSAANIQRFCQNTHQRS
jgi:hypothetical protein